MVYLFLVLTMFSAVYCHEIKTDEQLAPEAAIENVELKTVVPIATEISLRQLAAVYKKLMHDKDAIQYEQLEDESLRKAVSETIDQRLYTIKSVLDVDAPELARQVEEEYAEPQRKLILYSCVAVASVSIGLLALFSYDATTGTWGAPKLANAANTLGKAVTAIGQLLDNDAQKPAAT